MINLYILQVISNKENGLISITMKKKNQGRYNDNAAANAHESWGKSGKNTGAKVDEASR